MTPLSLLVLSATDVVQFFAVLKSLKYRAVLLAASLCPLPAAVGSPVVLHLRVYDLVSTPGEKKLEITYGSPEGSCIDSHRSIA